MNVCVCVCVCVCVQYSHSQFRALWNGCWANVPERISNKSTHNANNDQVKISNLYSAYSPQSFAGHSLSTGCCDFLGPDKEMEPGILRAWKKRCHGLIECFHCKFIFIGLQFRSMQTNLWWLHGPKFGIVGNAFSWVELLKRMKVLDLASINRKRKLTRIEETTSAVFLKIRR